MIKLDKDRNVTQEYLDYVSSLKREDLERFYIGADLFVDRLNNIINEIEKWCDENYHEDAQYGYDLIDYNDLKDKIKELKGVNKND